MLNKTKLILSLAGVLLLIGGAFFVKYEYANYKALETKMLDYRNNERAYEDIISKQNGDNRVLILSNADLKYSNDKMVHSIDSIRKSLKTPKNASGDVSTGIVTVIHDTATILLSNIVGCAIDTVLKHNEFTQSRIILNNNELKDILDVNNIEYLYVYSTREYVTVYKNGLIRLLHLDWHKETIDRYDIQNTNKLIKVTDVRVIKIRQ